MAYIGIRPAGISNAAEVEVTGDLTVDTNTLFVDASNNNVGIGTTSAGGSLEVYKAGTSEVLIGTDNGGTAQLSLYEANDGTKEGLLKYDGTNNRIHLATSGAPNALVIPRDSGNVGIGTSSPSDLLHVYNSSGDAAVRIQGNTRTFKIEQDNYGLRVVDVNAGSAERIRIPAGGGLTFNGDTAAANALDDYEEGTWTPAYAAASGTITSHSNSSGFYTKVGRMVYIQGYVSYQSDSSASGSITVTGLPFTSSSTGYGQSNNQAGGVASYVNSLFSANSPDGGRIPNNATLIMPFVNASGGATQLDFSNFSTSANHSQFVFFGHYFI